MRNGSMTDKLRMQEREIKQADIPAVEKKNTIDTTIRQQISTSVNQSNNSSVSQSNDGNGLSSLFSILPSSTDVSLPDDQQPLKPKKKKKRRPRIS